MDTATCGLPIDANFVIQVVGRDYLDRDGNWIGATVMNNAVGTLAANGSTLDEHDTWVDHYTDMTDTLTGLAIHVTFPGGGLVIRDAGSVEFNQGGSITFIRGPHPDLEGDLAGYCAAFR